MPDKQIKKTLIILLFASFLVRALLAGLTEMGNDEVYYRLYALYPAWSHFDHPPMVGWVISFFTLNLTFQAEFFLRLGALVFGTISTWVIFLIGKKIKDELTGLYAAFLYTASIYCSVIAGTFIMPDTPQVLFWLLTILFLAGSLPDKNLAKESRRRLLWAGVMMGMALLSKYHSAFLISGALLYVLFFNRRWFSTRELYLSFLIALILFLPVIWWNYQNDFISFTFHEARVDNIRSVIRWDFIGTELAGQFLYNNPVNVVIILFAFFALVKRNDFIRKDYAGLILLISLPLSLTFLIVSFTNRTLPHWTGPAYLGYVLIAAAWLSGLKSSGRVKSLVPVGLKISLGLIIFFVVLGLVQIKSGIIPMDKLGITDPTIQLNGYRQMGKKFKVVAELAEADGDVIEGAPILATNWFPAANFDFYVGMPAHKKVYAIGNLERMHKFFWIDQRLGPLRRHLDMYYIGMSDDHPAPGPELFEIFDSVKCRDTLSITRCNRLIRTVFVYRMYGLKKEIRFDSIHNFIEGRGY